MNKQININEIPIDKKYIGYLWLSDNPQPKEYHTPTDLKDVFKDFSDTTNPFIIEGQLCCKEIDQNQKITIYKSYSIKYADGQHIVIECDLTKIPDSWVVNDERQFKRFIPNRLQASKIVFIQYWKPEEENTINKEELSCLGMPVFAPGPLVFVGFEYNKEKEEE